MESSGGASGKVVSETAGGSGLSNSRWTDKCDADGVKVSGFFGGDEVGVSMEPLVVA